MKVNVDINMKVDVDMNMDTEMEIDTNVNMDNFNGHFTKQSKHGRHLQFFK
jgi:hypothetical protein